MTKTVTPIKQTAPRAGEHFRYVAALPIEGGKRRKLAAIVAAYIDGGRISVTTAELAERLDWPPPKVVVLAKRLQVGGILRATNSKRWRLADEITARVTAAQSPDRERLAA